MTRTSSSNAGRRRPRRATADSAASSFRLTAWSAHEVRRGGESSSGSGSGSGSFGGGFGGGPRRASDLDGTRPSSDESAGGRLLSLESSSQGGRDHRPRGVEVMDHRDHATVGPSALAGGSGGSSSSSSGNIVPIDDDEASGYFPVAHRSLEGTEDAYRVVGAGGDVGEHWRGDLVGQWTRAAVASEASCRTIAVGNDDDEEEEGGGDERSHGLWSQVTERRRGGGSSLRRGGRGPASAAGTVEEERDFVSVGAVRPEEDTEDDEEEAVVDEEEDDDDGMNFDARSVQSSGSSQLWDRLESNRVRMEAADRKLHRLTQEGPLKNKKLLQRMRRQRYVRRCARAMLGFVALAALGLSAAYFIVGEDLEGVFAGDLFRRLFGNTQDKEQEQDHLRYRILGNNHAQDVDDAGNAPIPRPLIGASVDKKLTTQTRTKLEAEKGREERVAARVMLRREEARERREQERLLAKGVGENAAPLGRQQGLPPEKNLRARQDDGEGRIRPQ